MHTLLGFFLGQKRCLPLISDYQGRGFLFFIFRRTRALVTVAIFLNIVTGGGIKCCVSDDGVADGGSNRCGLMPFPCTKESNHLVYAFVILVQISSVCVRAK